MYGTEEQASSEAGDIQVRVQGAPRLRMVTPLLSGWVVLSGRTRSQNLWESSFPGSLAGRVSRLWEAERWFGDRTVECAHPGEGVPSVQKTRVREVAVYPLSLTNTWVTAHQLLSTMGSEIARRHSIHTGLLSKDEKTTARKKRKKGSHCITLDYLYCLK